MTDEYKVPARFLADTPLFFPDLAEHLVFDESRPDHAERQTRDNPALLVAGDVVDLRPKEIHERADFEFVNASDESAYLAELEAAAEDQEDEDTSTEPPPQPPGVPTVTPPANLAELEASLESREADDDTPEV